MLILTEPAVAWKNDPCGKWSKTVAPACTIAAPDIGATPEAIIAGANVADAIVAPDVVDAVAADINIPDIGANVNAGIFIASSIDIVVACNVEAFIIPATVPVPIKSIATGIIFEIPNVIYSLRYLNLPIAITPTIPPIGKAKSGSTAIPTNGLSESNIIATNGPTIAVKKDGKFVSTVASSNSCVFISVPLNFLANIDANITVTIRPTNAGIIFAAIKDDKFTPKFSAADIVFGLGDIMLPAFPPPIIVKSITIGEYPNFLAIASAIGATVITATSTKTPTAVNIIVDKANANNALFSPN